MFWSLITALVAAFAGGGIGMLLRHLSGKRLNIGVVPVCAGIAMLIATVATEYGWAPNVQRTMASDLVVISEREQQAWYQPWTYVQPWVRGFVAYSPAETVELAPGSSIYAVQVSLQERWQPQMVLPILVDCANQRRAEILPDTTFDDAGLPQNAGWREVASSDPTVNTVCEREAADS